jgi:CheY-like chemotaxis protein
VDFCPGNEGVQLTQQKRILLVDDEPNIRFVLATILQQEGYVVDVAEDGFKALRKLQQNMPDLVITDLRMPNMNGFELLSVIRTRFVRLPIIVVSGEFVSVNVPQGTLADAFFQKGNYTIPDFLAKISELLVSPLRPTPDITSMPAVWKPIGDATVMLTCTKCLRSFPIEVCEAPSQPKILQCIFCGTRLEVHLVAVGMTAKAAD